MPTALALHGFDSSGAALARALAPLLPARLGWTLVCPDGPVLLPSGRRAWFRAIEPGPEYVGAMQAVAALDELARDSPRFDLAVGFSQGASMLFVWQALSSQPTHRRHRQSLYLGPPWPIRDAALAARISAKDPMPVVAYGTEDPLRAHAHFAVMPHRLVTFEGGHHPPNTDKAASAVLAALPPPRHWFAFDMDGVIVDSARECGITAWMACGGLVEGAGLNTLPSEKQLADFCRVRPLLEHGFEALVLWYRLQRESVEDMLRAGEDAAARMEAARRSMGETVDQLKQRFKEARTEWIARDEAGWYAANGFYAPIVECLANLAARGEAVYVITTKSKEFARRLLDKVGLSVIDDAHLFGLSSRTKAEIISDVAHGSEAARGGTCLFIEDRVDTLLDVAAKARCPTQLVLAGYGYNTDYDKRKASDAGMIVTGTPLQLREFCLQLQ